VRKLSPLLEAFTAIVVVVWMARRRHRHVAPPSNAWQSRIDPASPTSREPTVAREIIRSPVVAAVLTIVAALLFGPSLLGLAATPVATPIATPAPTPVATPIATPAPTPVATPIATPAPTPVATPIATPEGTAPTRRPARAPPSVG
jgi:hypothetical protein